MSINCKNCKKTISEDSKFCDANMGFTKGQLYAYSDRIEFVSKKVIKKMYYYNLKKVKKSFGVIDLKTIEGENEAFSVEDNIDEWIKLIDDRMIYFKENNLNIEVKKDITINLEKKEKENEKLENSYNKIKEFLKEKDGKVHIIMINGKIYIPHEELSCEDRYTNEVDSVVSFMQDDGYEIIDVKYQLVGSSENRYSTLIMYK